jgi:hypothetical protein
MVVPFRLTGNYDADPHHFRVYETTNNDNEDWLKPLAEEYVRLLTRRETRLRNITISEDTTLDMSRVSQYIRRASIPNYEAGNFGVVRSDFGELLCYLLLERDYGTMFGEKSIYARELKDRSGRGIDAIGIEDKGLLALVLCEVKVSSDRSSPPGVVDQGEECLSRQHRHHLTNLYEETKNKVCRAANRARDERIAELLTAAVICLAENRLDRLRIIICNLLVRPKAKYKKTDFGSFRTNPGQYSPAAIRFLIACIPDDVDAIIRKWYDVVQTVEVSV